MSAGLFSMASSVEKHLVPTSNSMIEFLCPYPLMRSQLWPDSGRHILAHCPKSAETIVVYQAFNDDIAKYAVGHQTFIGCLHYSESRMTWIKPNFLWMMYRCGWATKDKNQTRVLALEVKIDGFEEILRRSVSSSARYGDNKPDVVCQWDPDHLPNGDKEVKMELTNSEKKMLQKYPESLGRRAIQLGIRGDTLDLFLHEMIIAIEDITDTIVAPNRHLKPDKMILPFEQVYLPIDAALHQHLLLGEGGKRTVSKYPDFSKE